MSRFNVHGLPPHLRKDKRGYLLDYFIQEGGVKKRRRVRLGNIPLAQAKKVLAQNMQEIIEERFLAPEKPKILFEEAADAFLAYSQLRKKSFRQDGYYVQKLKEYFKGKPLEDLNLDMVEAYLVKRRKDAAAKGKPISDVSLNREIMCLKTIARRAVLNRQILWNPIQGVRLFKENPRSRVLTTDEYQRLLAGCAPYMRPIVELAYMTGMRRGEILNLRWDQIDFQEKVIVLEASDTKTQERREIPLDDVLADTLKKVPKTLNCPYVFTHRGKKMSDPKEGFWNACERAGIKDLHFHDLRHCAVTNFRKAGVPENTIMSISGHKTHSVFRRYDQIDREDRQAALERARKHIDSRMAQAGSGVQKEGSA